MVLGGKKARPKNQAHVPDYLRCVKSILVGRSISNVQNLIVCPGDMFVMESGTVLGALRRTTVTEPPVQGFSNAITHLYA